MSNSLKLRVLGPLELFQDEIRVTEIQTHKTLALLTYLAMTGQPHSRSALAGLLWGGMPEVKARGSLSKALSMLRPVAGEYLNATRQTVALEADDGFWCDVAVFEAAANSNAPEGLQAAVALYRGDFLADFYVRDAPEFEDWVLPQRTRLRRLALQALHTLASYFAEQDERGRIQAIEYCTHLLQLEPWREEAHRQMIELLAYQGDRSAALAQYETCRQMLAEELDVEPDPETVALYEQIRDGKLGRQPQEPRPDSALTTVRHNLPAQTTPFLGRESQLSDLTHLLTDPDVRLVTILGPGGIGKTRLALEVVATLLDDFHHGIYLVALAPLSDPEAIISAIATSVGYTFQNDGRAAKQQVCDYLRDKAMLLVLDNAEHLLDGVDFFVEILQAAPQVRLLVTSRERLQLNSETIYNLSGLTLSDTANYETSGAAQLFIQTGQRVRPTFSPTSADWPALTQVCQLVGGMPLGLILAASWIEILTPAEIVAEISRSFDFLAADLRDLPERQRSLHAVFVSTWQRLSETEQDVFKRMAPFRGGFTREAAQAVTGASLLTLIALSHKSLIQHSPNGRYEIHELLRQFAMATLAGQKAEVCDAHSAYYSAFLQQREGDLKGARQQSALAEVEADGENVRAAWEWGVEQVQIEQLMPSLDSLGLFYLARSRFYEGQALCQLAVERLSTISYGGNRNSQPSSDQLTQAHLRVRVSIWLSIFNRYLGQPGTARQVVQQAQILLEQSPLVEVDTRVEQAQLLLERAENTHSFNIEQTRELVEQSLALYRTLNDPWRMAQALDLLGNSLLTIGLIAQSRQVTKEGLALRQELGDVRGIAVSHQNLGTSARWGGDFEEAETRFRKSIAIFQQLHDRHREAEATYFLAGTCYHSGYFSAIPEMYEKCLRIYHELNLSNERDGSMLLMLGSVKMQLGRYESACADLQQSLSINSEVGKKRLVSYAWKNLGFIALAKLDHGETQQLLREGLAVAHASSESQCAGEILGGLGYLALRRNDRHQAQIYLRESLQVAVDTGLILPSLTALVGVALLRADQDAAEEAVELYALALQHGYVANSRWFDDIAGQQIAAVAEALPPEVATAAQTRGQALDLAPTLCKLLVELGF